PSRLVAVARLLGGGILALGPADATAARVRRVPPARSRDLAPAAPASGGADRPARPLLVPRDRADPRAGPGVRRSFLGLGGDPERVHPELPPEPVRVRAGAGGEPGPGLPPREPRARAPRIAAAERPRPGAAPAPARAARAPLPLQHPARDRYPDPR